MRILTQQDREMLSLIYTDLENLHNKYYIRNRTNTRSGKVFTLINSNGELNDKYYGVYEISKDRLIVTTADNAESIHILSKHGLFDTHIKSLYDFSFTDDLILITTESDAYCIINKYGDTKIITKCKEYKKIVYLGFNQYALVRVRDIDFIRYEPCGISLDIINNKLETVKDNVSLDEKFQQEYGISDVTAFLSCNNIVKLNKPIR